MTGLPAGIGVEMGAETQAGLRIPHAAPAPALHLARSVGKSECVEALNINHPKLVIKTHKRFVKAGAEVLFTNSRGAAPQLLRSVRMFDEAFAVSYLGAELARTVADEAAHQVRVIGDIRLPSRVPVTGFMAEDDIASATHCLVSAQVAGGVDAVLIDVAARPSHVAAAMNGARWGMTDTEKKVPLMLLLRPLVQPGPLDYGRIHEDLAQAAALAATQVAAIGVNPDTIPESVPELVAHIMPYWKGAIALSPAADAAMVRRLCADPIRGRRLAFLPSSSLRDLRRALKTSLGATRLARRRESI